MGLEEIKAGNMTDEGEGVDQEIRLSDLIAALQEEISSSQILKSSRMVSNSGREFLRIQKQMAFPHTFGFE